VLFSGTPVRPRSAASTGSSRREAGAARGHRRGLDAHHRSDRCGRPAVEDLHGRGGREGAVEVSPTGRAFRIRLPSAALSSMRGLRSTSSATPAAPWITNGSGQRRRLQISTSVGASGSTVVSAHHSRTSGCARIGFATTRVRGFYFDLQQALDHCDVRSACKQVPTDTWKLFLASRARARTGGNITSARRRRATRWARGRLEDLTFNLADRLPKRVSADRFRLHGDVRPPWPSTATSTLVLSGAPGGHH